MPPAFARAIEFASAGLDILVLFGIAAVGLTVVARAHPLAGRLLAAGAGVRFLAVVFVQLISTLQGTSGSDWVVRAILTSLASVTGNVVFWASVTAAVVMLARRAGAEEAQ